MFPYLVAFVISIVATYLASLESNNTGRRFLFSIFAIAPLVLLAAFRAHNVGTDTPNYVILIHDAMTGGHNLPRYIFMHPSYEVGFLTYNFLLGKLVSSVEGYFLITYTLIVGLPYLSAMKLRKVISPHIFMLIFYTLFFSDSLNAMRQYIAIAFVMFAVANLLTDRTKLYVLFTVLAMFFHTSAVISFVIGMLYYFTARFPLRDNKVIYLIISLIAFVVILNMDMFTRLNILPVIESKLQNQLENELDGGVSNSHILVAFCTLVFLLYSYGQKNPVLDMFMILNLLTLVFYVSPSMNATLYRLTLYFNTMMCFSVAYVYKGCLARGKIRYAAKVLLMLYVAFYFFSIVISKTNQVIPYELYYS